MTAARSLPGSANDALSFRKLLAVTAIYWVYVTLSNILYAQSLRVGFSEVTKAELFVSWDVRLFQHLALFPALVACLWLSLRAGWKPLWRALPLQWLLALCFAVAAAPALLVGERLFSREYMSEHSHAMMGDHSWISSGSLALWLASATSFFFVYAFGLAAINGLSWYQRYRDTQLRVTALESNWNAARLAALRMQLSPHTLFNLLNTIHGQIAWEPQARAVDGHPARRPAATPAQRRRARILAPGGRTAVRAALPGAADAALPGQAQHLHARYGRHSGCLGAQPDPATPGGECRRARSCRT